MQNGKLWMYHLIGETRKSYRMYWSSEIIVRNFGTRRLDAARVLVCRKSLGKSKEGKSINRRMVLTNFVTIEDISTYIQPKVTRNPQGTPIPDTIV